MIKAILFATLLLIVMGCNRPKKVRTVQTVATRKDSIAPRRILFDLDSLEIEQQKYLDTNNSYLKKLLDSALKLSKLRGFAEAYSITIDTSAFHYSNMYAEIEFGHIFSEDRNHLIIKRFIKEEQALELSLYSDIYLVENDKFLKVAADTSDMGYDDNSLDDVNADGYDDYLVGSYSPTGCCPRDLEIAFLYNHRNGHFHREEFLNRELGSSDKYFYEASYGLGKYSILYKYKWAGLKKVLTEEIYVTEIGTDKNPTSYTKVVYPSKQKVRLKRLPKEYQELQMAEYITKIGGDDLDKK